MEDERVSKKKKEEKESGQFTKIVESLKNSEDYRSED